MKATFWFDPSCPFTWITSRWMVDIAEERKLDVSWQPFSLLIKNGDDMPDEYLKPAEHSLGALRVVVALNAGGQADKVGDFYSEIGRRFHNEGEQTYSIAGSLEAVGIDPSFADSAEDESLTETVKASMDEALSYAGDDVGVPIITLPGTAGSTIGFFGPVVTEMPTHEDALRIFDLAYELAGISAFTELKRRRGELTIPPA